MDSALISVVSFVFIILLGLAAARVGGIGRGADTLISRIVFRLTLPAAIINAFGSADFQPQLLLLVVAGFACTALPYLVALAVFRRAPAEDRAYYLLNVGGMNIGCFALPFIQALFPASGVVAACMFDAGNSIMSTGGSFALTKTLLGQDHDEHPVRTICRRLFSSTPFDCYVVLIALGIAGVRLPQVIIDLTAPIANANAFLSLFMLGLMVSVRLDARQAGKLARLLTVRVALCMLMTVAALAVLPFDATTRAVIACVMWGPAPSMSPVFTLWCGGDHGLSGLTGAITILIGIVAMAVILLMLGVL